MRDITELRYHRQARPPDRRPVTPIDWEQINPRLERTGRKQGLSLREAQCLVAAAHGYSNVMIGRQLGISLDTVKTHFRRLFARKHINDRAQAVNWAWEHGLLPLDQVAA